VIGAHYIRIKDVERASFKASTLRKYQNIWLVCILKFTVFWGPKDHT